MSSGTHRPSRQAVEPHKIGDARPAARSLNDIAYRAIKDDIISWARQPGGDISEGGLAARYRLGKAPIRSAMMRLRQEGLIVSRGRQGNAVSAVTLRDVCVLGVGAILARQTAMRVVERSGGSRGVATLRNMMSYAGAAFVTLVGLVSFIAFLDVPLR